MLVQTEAAGYVVAANGHPQVAQHLENVRQTWVDLDRSLYGERYFLDLI